MGTRPSAVATLVERRTRYLRIVPLPDRYKADAVRHAIAADLGELPPGMRRSLTWDRGREMAEHQELAAQLAIDVYFCDPRSPWQRGSNENANRLLREYLAKGADPSPVLPARPRHRETDQHQATARTRLGDIGRAVWPHVHAVYVP